MKITIELPDTLKEADWDYIIQPAGSYLEEVEQALFFTRGGEPYHRTCADCGAHIHADLHVTVVEAEFVATLVPRVACPRCGNEALGPYVDPAFSAIAPLSDRDKERLRVVFVDGEEKMEKFIKFAEPPLPPEQLQAAMLRFGGGEPTKAPRKAQQRAKAGAS